MDVSTLANHPHSSGPCEGQVLLRSERFRPLRDHDVEDILCVGAVWLRLRSQEVSYRQRFRRGAPSLLVLIGPGSLLPRVTLVLNLLGLPLVSAGLHGVVGTVCGSGRRAAVGVLRFGQLRQRSPSKYTSVGHLR